jgi:hypothetical protein
VDARLGERPILQRCLPQEQNHSEVMTTLLIIHAAITWALLGLMWTIQLEHYPLLKNVGHREFVFYHDRHMSLVSWLVGPLMMAEIGSAGLLFYLGERSLPFVISLGALGSVWASTAIGQIPLHQKLTRGYHADSLRHSTPCFDMHGEQASLTPPNP